MSETKYGNDPIREALCQFRFDSSQKWDWTIPGLIFSKIHDEYPNKRELTTVGFEIKGGKDLKIAPSVTSGITGMQFLNKDGNRLIQVSEHILTINQLEPYNNWNEFKSRILKAFKVYNEITEQKGITQLGLRYINHIETIPPESTIESYFNYYPAFPDKNQDVIGPVYMRSTIPKPNIKKIKGVLNMVFAIGEMNPQTEIAPWILDLDMIIKFNINTSLNIESLEEKLDIAHNYLEETFEASITNKLRELIK